MYLHKCSITTFISKDIFYLAASTVLFFFFPTIVGYVLVLSCHNEMCCVEIKNSYRLLKIRSVDQNQLFIAVYQVAHIAESSWVPNKSSEASIHVFLIMFFLFVSRNAEFSTLQKIRCGFLALEEQEKVIAGPYSIASFVSCAKILNCST